MTRIVFAILFLGLTESVLGCSDVVMEKDITVDVRDGLSCEQYDRIAEDHVVVQELLAWADTFVFSRRLDSMPFITGDLPGPGRRDFTVDNERFQFKGVPWLKSYEVRVIDQDSERPRAIFITAGKYRGLVVTRAKLSESVTQEFLQTMPLTMKQDRLAVLCYLETL